MAQVLVSVVIPVYNGEEWIETCLQSVLHQMTDDMEVIVVNDGSTDGSEHILQRMAEKDGRIRLFSQKNSGVAAARNKALSMCRGKYIRFVDADDFLPDGSMNILLDKAQQNDSDLVIAGYTEIHGKTKTKRNLKKSDETMPLNDILPHMNHWANSFFYGALWNKLFRGDVIREHGLQFMSGLQLGEDFAFVCNYMMYAEKVSYSTKAVYDYRRNAGGMTAKQLIDCVLHPLSNCHMKWVLYKELRKLYQHRGVYPKYRRTLWLYLFRITLSN